MNVGEKVLVNQFKFGFELEAFVVPNKADKANPDLCTYDASYLRAEKYIKEFFPDAGGLDSDGSLEAGRRGGYEFEWPSPVLDFTPANINKCINFLKGLKAQGIYTNSTCGFHVHLSFPEMSFDDIRWVVLQVAMDDKVQKMISKFHGRNFYTDEYANKEFLTRIRRTVNSNEEREKKLAVLHRHLSTDKYRTLRIHPQGTLEWRGPRGFLERRKAGIVKDFFKLLWQFNRWISRAVTTKVVAGFTKEEFFANDNMFWECKHQRLIERVSENTELVNKINDNTVVQLLSSRPYLASSYTKEFSAEMQDTLVTRMSYRDLIYMWGRFDSKHQLDALFANPYLATYRDINQNYVEDAAQVELIRECVARRNADLFYNLFGYAEFRMKPEAVKFAAEKCPRWFQRVIHAQPRSVQAMFKRYTEQANDSVKLAA